MGMKHSLLALGMMTAMAQSPLALPAAPSYPIPNGWAPSRRNGNNRSEGSAKRHAKAKAAYKSKRAQRKKAKR